MQHPNVVRLVKTKVITNSNFNPELGERVGIHVQTAETTGIKVSVFARSGKLLRVLWDSAALGTLELAWDGLDAKGLNLPSGIYVVAVEMGGKTETRKITIKR